MIHPQTAPALPPALGPAPFWNWRIAGRNAGNLSRPWPLRDLDGTNGRPHGSRPSLCDVLGRASPRDRVRVGDPRHQVGAASGGASDAGSFAPASRIVPLVVRAIAAGPHHRERGILYAEIDPEAARRARRSLDVCGHYSRPDIFSFSVDRKPRAPATFLD